MQWVAKRHIAIAAIFTTLAIALFTELSTDSISLDSELPPATSCFDEQSATIRVTTLTGCPAPLISLGSTAITESRTASGMADQLHPLLQARFDAAKRAAEFEGVTLYITSGYRSQDRQAILYANAIKKYGSETEAAKWVLPAAFSHHPHGLAIDVNYPGGPAGAKWLEEYGSRFGLCRVYANEWWHFEGVIAPGQACPAMAENALVDLG